MPYVREVLKSSTAIYLEESYRLTGGRLSKPLRSCYGSHLVRLIFFLRKLEVIIHKYMKYGLNTFNLLDECGIELYLETKHFSVKWIIN